VLALYTDDITENENGAGEEFGERCLTEGLRQHRELSCQALLTAIVDEVGNLALSTLRGSVVPGAVTQLRWTTGTPASLWDVALTSAAKAGIQKPGLSQGLKPCAAQKPVPKQAADPFHWSG
jgi:hypothetical protein